MSAIPSATAITLAEQNYLPAVIAGVQAAEMTGQAGPAKMQAVLNALGASSQALEGNPDATVAGLAAMVHVVVAIFNATGFFGHTPKTTVRGG
jgi:hypothetical protein